MDKIQELSDRLKEISECFTEWKKSGVSEEVLICWLTVKLKASRKHAEKIVRSYEEFFNSFIAKEVLDGLK